MNIKQAFIAIDVSRQMKRTLHLIGKHGIGKSSIVYQYAAQHGYEVAEIRVGQMADAGDLIGLQEFIKNPKDNVVYATKHILPSWFMESVTSGKKVIIFIDELNRGAKDLLQAIFELVYDLSLKGVKMNEESFVIAASNPPTDDYAVLDFSDSAFQDRFVHVKLEPTPQEFLAYAKDKGMSQPMIDFIGEYPQQLEDQGLANFQLDFVKPSRRSWEAVSRLDLINVADENVYFEMLQGIVGLTASVAYRDFKTTYVQSLKAEQILNDFDGNLAALQKVIAKKRNDMIATLNEDINTYLKGVDGLTAVQGDSLIKLITLYVKSNMVEHGFVLGNVVKENSKATRNVEGMTNDGLLNNDAFIEPLVKLKTMRDEAREKPATTKKTKKVKETEEAL